ncbi:MAG: enhanced intracellular survival protein Eis [Dysgonomonas sp.]
MENNKLKDSLKIKPVGIKYLDQYNELLRYVFQVTNQDLQESGYEDGEIIRAKRPILKKAEVIGWFHGEQLVSQLCIYPCQVNIHGKIYQMGGLTGVGTYPEYTNMGLMNELIKVGLNKMRNKGQWISYLYPYSVPYYRNKGWEIMSDHMTFTIKDAQLPKHQDVDGHVERHPIDHEDVISTYDKFAHASHGAMIRGELEWDEYWRWENEEERTAAVYYNSSDEPTGYIMYWIAEDIFHIKEIIYLNQEARKGLWNFILAHDSMIDMIKGDIYQNEPIAFLLDDSQITETIEPYFMARIVDVAAFLENYPFVKKAKPFHFVVTDPIAEWNRGIFGIEWDEDKKVNITRNEAGSPVYIDIKTLTALLMSYRSPAYFYKIEHLKTDAKTLNLLEEIIPKEQPYFSDYF